MDECLICRTLVSTTEKDEGHLHRDKDKGGGLDLLQNEIEAFYFLHKLLKIPLDLITSLLVRRGGGDFISSSYTLCAPCRLSYLMEGRRIFTEMQRLEAAHDELRRVIVTKMRVKVETEEEEDLDLCLLPEVPSSKGRGDEIREYLLMHYGRGCGDQDEVASTPAPTWTEVPPPDSCKSVRLRRKKRHKKKSLVDHCHEDEPFASLDDDKWILPDSGMPRVPSPPDSDDNIDDEGMMRPPVDTFLQDSSSDVEEVPEGKKKEVKNKTKSENKRPCDICEKLIHRNSLSRHMLQLHSSKPISLPRGRPKRLVKVGNQLPCQVCKRSFLTQASLDRHLIDTHKVVVKKKKEDSKSHVLHMNHSCPICKSGFNSEAIFQAHSHPDPKDPSIVTYNCPECPRVFPTGKSFKHHFYLTHSGKVVCEICGVVCPNPPQLNYHMEWKHRTKDLHCCSQCDLRFPSAYERVNHERVVHKGLPSTECYFCHRFCLGISSLEKHLRIHTLERPFRCTKCGKDFKAENGLKRHVDVVCGDDDEARRRVRQRRNEIMRRHNAMKKHICHICGNRFGQKPQLKNHLERHHTIS